MIVDSHVHLWQIARGDYDWMTGPGTEALAPIRRDFAAGDLRPLLGGAGVDRVVLVQAAATVAESRFLLQQAAAMPQVAGVVGWVAMDDAAVEDSLEELAADDAFKGVRPMIHDIADPDWMLGDALTPAFRALVRKDLAFDCLVRPLHLPNLLTLLGRHPDLRAVICHGAKPEIEAGRFTDWAAQMTALAQETAAFCKLSGLITEAGPGWTPAGLRPYVEHLLEIFGPKRLIWGSDWPVLTLTASYDDWWTAAHGLLADLSETDKAAVFGGNALRAYRL